MSELTGLAYLFCRRAKDKGCDKYEIKEIVERTLSSMDRRVLSIVEQEGGE